MSRWGGRKVSELKWLVASTWGTRCWVCDLPIDMRRRWPDPLSPSVEHTKPRSKGGTDDLRWLRLSHLHCNIVRGNRTVSSVRSGFVAPALAAVLGCPPPPEAPPNLPSPPGTQGKRS